MGCSKTKNVRPLSGPDVFSYLLGQNLFLTLQQLIGQEHRLYLLKAQAGHRVGKPLLGLAVGLEEEEALLHQGQDLFFA